MFSHQEPVCLYTLAAAVSLTPWQPHLMTLWLINQKEPNKHLPNVAEVYLCFYYSCHVRANVVNIMCKKKIEYLTLNSPELTCDDLLIISASAG